MKKSAKGSGIAASFISWRKSIRFFFYYLLTLFIVEPACNEKTVFIHAIAVKNMEKGWREMYVKQKQQTEYSKMLSNSSEIWFTHMRIWICKMFIRRQILVALKKKTNVLVNIIVVSSQYKALFSNSFQVIDGRCS